MHRFIPVAVVRLLSEATVGHCGQQCHCNRFNRHHNAHGTVLVVSEIASMSIAKVALLGGWFSSSAEIALREASAFDHAINDFCEALIFRIEESTKSGSCCNLLSAGIIGRSNTLMAVKSVLRENLERRSFNGHSTAWCAPCVKLSIWLCSDSCALGSMLNVVHILQQVEWAGCPLTSPLHRP